MVFQAIARKIFGTQNERELKTIYPYVEKINALEPSMKALSDAQLKNKTAEFKERYAKGESLDSILPEAFAVTREASWRVIGQRHYDVQLIGGITLHRGKIAEMRTGEGKTLVATLPCYLNALTGKGVHVITVNDYLAKRDATWMSQIYGFLGLSTGIIVHGLNDKERKLAYACDITYGTNNEFGFDYLRDNMKFKLEDYVQRDLHFAIVDEVDSILIDEARTPLIISGPSEQPTGQYYEIDRHIRQSGGLTPEEDYTIDEKSKTASLTDKGVDKMEKRLGIPNLYDPIHIETLHHVHQALRAHVIYKADVDYVVRNGEILIVDEFTGRLMPGRRWSDGLHQAIEAKEGVEIENENQTLATITFQNYFRMYQKLSGMTGTADTEALEFKQIYKLDVSIIPTNRSMIRIDHPDLIFKTHQFKLNAIVEEIKRITALGQPILVGTISVEKSEQLSNLLKKNNVVHHVLNAKQHEKEAEIVAQAGKKKAVTISTNMAGRGTDILLGGNAEYLAKKDMPPQPIRLNTPESEEAARVWEEDFEKKLNEWKEKCAKEREEVKALGGLFIIGTERHESRRIDNQLRGRAGRQGDPGASRFYLSLDDDLMRIFGGTRMANFMEDDVPIEHSLITRAIENAQKKVEAHNYDIRKHLLEYDDVMNQQRKVIYSWRSDVLSKEDLKPMVVELLSDYSKKLADQFFPNNKPRKQSYEFLSQKSTQKDPSHLENQKHDHEHGHDHNHDHNHNHDKEYHLIEDLNQTIHSYFHFESQIKEDEIVPYNGIGAQKSIFKCLNEQFEQKILEFGQDTMKEVQKGFLLGSIDQLWKDHLLAMDHMREGIGLQGYGQKDPLIEYKKQGFSFFKMMMDQIEFSVLQKLLSSRMGINFNTDNMDSPSIETLLEHLNDPDMPPELREKLLEFQKLELDKIKRIFEKKEQLPTSINLNVGGKSIQEPISSDQPKTGRNELCPCGSGKKFKKCHG